MSRRGAAFVAILEKTMSAKRSGDFRRQPIVIASTVGPLGDAELSLAVVALADIAPQWSVELQGICSEQTTLVLLPEDGDDENGPSFVVSREAYGFRLDQIREIADFIEARLLTGKKLPAAQMSLTINGDCIPLPEPIRSQLAATVGVLLAPLQSSLHGDPGSMQLTIQYSQPIDEIS